MMNKFGRELGEFLDFNNISYIEFAFRIGTTPKNLIDIINGDIRLTQEMINNISIVSGIPITYIENVENSFRMDEKIKLFLKDNKETAKDYLKKFKYKEAIEKYDIRIQDERDDLNIIRDLIRYFRISDLQQLYEETRGLF